MRVGRRIKRRGGAALVETAVVLPVLLTMVLGLIEMSRLGMVAQLLTTAAREGCRTAIIPGNDQASIVQGRINQILGGAGIASQSLQVVDTDPGSTGAYLMRTNWNTAAGGTAITVTLRIPYSQLSWLAQPVFLKNVNVTASATMSSERP